MEDQNDHALHQVALMLFDGSAQLPLPRGVPLGYLVTKLQAENEDEGFNAELAHNLLCSDSSFRLLALHLVTRELSLQHHLSFQPSGPLTAVVEVRWKQAYLVTHRHSAFSAHGSSATWRKSGAGTAAAATAATAATRGSGRTSLEKHCSGSSKAT